MSDELVHNNFLHFQKLRKDKLVEIQKTEKKRKQNEHKVALLAFDAEYRKMRVELQSKQKHDIEELTLEHNIQLDNLNKIFIEEMNERKRKNNDQIQSTSKPSSKRKLISEYECNDSTNTSKRLRYNDFDESIQFEHSDRQQQQQPCVVEQPQIITKIINESDDHLLDTLNLLSANQSMNEDNNLNNNNEEQIQSLVIQESLNVSAEEDLFKLINDDLFNELAGFVEPTNPIAAADNDSFSLDLNIDNKPNILLPDTEQTYTSAEIDSIFDSMLKSNQEKLT